MLQQVMTKPGEIIFREVEIPEVKDDQVLVKIMNIGICGSDIHVYHGKHPFTKYPVTQGHEVSGEIVKLGAGVQNFRVGEKVTIEPQVYCGHCYPCRHGKYNLCEELKVMGFQTTGTASEYFAVDASKVTPIPEDMSYEEGAMIEPLAVAVHGVKQMGDVTGMKIAVLGAGPIGNLVAQTAKGMGADKVMITDVSDLRLEKAKECGIDVCVNTAKKDFGEAMIEAFGPDKADVIYDCAGNNITMGQAIKYARKGSTIVLVAVFAGFARNAHAGHGGGLVLDLGQGDFIRQTNEQVIFRVRIVVIDDLGNQVTGNIQSHRSFLLLTETEPRSVRRPHTPWCC